MSVTYGAARFDLKQTLIPLSGAEQEDTSLRKRNKRSRRPWLELCLTAKTLLRQALRQKRLCPTSNICRALLSPQKPHSSSYHRVHCTPKSGRECGPNVLYLNPTLVKKLRVKINGDSLIMAGTTIDVFKSTPV